MNFTPEEIAGLLAEKHEKLVKETTAEYEALKKIIVLEEKVDQLSHWGGEGAFAKELESVCKAIEKLEVERRRLCQEMDTATP